jgi:hypothetical protein
MLRFIIIHIVSSQMVQEKSTWILGKMSRIYLLRFTTLHLLSSQMVHEMSTWISGYFLGYIYSTMIKTAHLLLRHIDQ